MPLLHVAECHMSYVIILFIYIYIYYIYLHTICYIYTYVLVHKHYIILILPKLWDAPQFLGDTVVKLWAWGRSPVEVGRLSPLFTVFLHHPKRWLVPTILRWRKRVEGLQA